MSSVPRISEITGHRSKEDVQAEREWQKVRAQFQNDRSRYAFGTPESKKAWQRRITRTRSL